MTTRPLSIGLLSAALLLFQPAVTMANPHATECCECFKISVVGMTPEGSFRSDPEGGYTAQVKISKDTSSGVTCPPKFKVTVGAALWNDNVLVHSDGVEVEVGDSEKVVEFKLTPELARLGNKWEFGSVCAGSNDDSEEKEAGEGVTIPGCLSETYPLEGCESCRESCAYTGEPSASNGSSSTHGSSDSEGGFKVLVPTTRSMGGTSEGVLAFFVEQFENPGRAKLFASVPSNFTVNRTGGLISSIDTGSATIEVAAADAALLALDPNAFVITHKDPTGTPFRATTISFVTEEGVARLRMDTALVGSPTTRYEQTRPQAGTFVLLRGQIHAGTGTYAPLLRDTLIRTKPSPGKRIDRQTVQERRSTSGAYGVVSDTETTYEKQLRGWMKTKEVIDPTGSSPLTSTWTYYQPGETSGPGASITGLGRLKQHIRYDGYEAFYTYSLNQATVATPYAGTPAAKVTTSTWNPGTKTYTTTTAINGTTVSKTITAHTATSTSRTEHTSAGQSLVTTTTYVPSGQDFGGMPLVTTHPDQTTTSRTNTRDAGGGYTTTSEELSSDATKGMRTIATVNSRGTTILRNTIPIGYGPADAKTFDSMAVISVDALGRPLETAWYPEITSTAGEQAAASGAKWTTTTEYSCCGVASETDQYGITTSYQYDGLQRQTHSRRLGVVTETRRDGLTTSTYRYPEGMPVPANTFDTFYGSDSNLVSRTVRNLSGTLRESSSPDPTGGSTPVVTSETTTYKPAAGLSRRTVTTTPDNFSQTTDYFLDGRTATTSGALAPAMQYSYSVNATGQVTTQSYIDGGNLRETTSTQSDWAGRTLRMDYMDGSFATMHYNTLGQMVKSTDPDEVVTLMAYNDRGEQTTTATDLNRDGAITYGTDTVQFSETVPALSENGNAVWRTIAKVWQDGQTNPLAGTVVSTSLHTSDGLISSTQSIGIENSSTTITTLSGGGNWTEKTTNPDGTYNRSTYVDGRMDIMESFRTDDTLISSTSLRDSTNAPLSGYDDLNRPTHQRDSRTGVSTTAYLSATADIVKYVTDPGNRTTAFTYDVRGRRTEVNAPDTLDADGNTLANLTITAYFPDGTVQETSGAQTYRTTHTYDYAQRQVTMTTYGTETATTEWKYSQDRGFLTEKNYHGEADEGNIDADYTYTDAGRLLTRTWERGKHTRYAYDAAGRMESTRYFLSRSDDTGTNAGNDADTPDVTIIHDALGRTVTQSNGFATSTFTYNAGNLQIDTETIEYDLDPDTAGYEFTRILDRSQDTLSRDSGWELKNGITVENSVAYDYGTTDGRLATVRGGGLHPPNLFNYSYLANSNLLETVTSSAHTITNSWESTRDVLESKQNKVGTTTVSAYLYRVNAIGQRTNVAQTGAAFGSVRDIVLGYDSLGQVTKADSTIPGLDRAYQFDLIGNRLKTAEGTTDPNDPTATTYTPTALNQYFSINNQSSIINPQFDSDGNATAYPLPANVNANSTLVWDGENRLISASVPDGDTVTFVYDAKSRRIAIWRSGLQPLSSPPTEITVYDGWNPIAEYSGTGALTKTNTWGMDLSGTMQGAGGVGGLLAVTDSTGTYYPTFDGNGNVSEYLNSTGTVVAHYEYDPFGKNTVASGSKAQDFSHRFSTKPLDATTGLYYYGYRFYDPVTGRWLSRDPIEERGGKNIYAAFNNNSYSYIDPDGRALFLLPIVPIIIKSVLFAIALDILIQSTIIYLDPDMTIVDFSFKSVGVSAVLGLVPAGHWFFKSYKSFKSIDSQIADVVVKICRRAPGNQRIGNLIRRLKDLMARQKENLNLMIMNSAIIGARMAIKHAVMKFIDNAENKALEEIKKEPDVEIIDRKRKPAVFDLRFDPGFDVDDAFIPNP